MSSYELNQRTLLVEGEQTKINKIKHLETTRHDNSAKNDNSDFLYMNYILSYKLNLFAFRFKCRKYENSNKNL